MKKSLLALLLLACALFIPSLATAAQIKVYVAEFAVAAPEPGSLKTTLQTLLTSRLASEVMVPVAAASDAEVIVTGSFTQLGKVFSLDAVAKSAAGKGIATAFEQGDNQDSLIPALGKISVKLRDDILKGYRHSEVTAATAAPAVSAAAAAAASAVPAVPAAPAALAAPATPQAVNSEIVRQEAPKAWTSQRIAGAQVSLAPAAGKEYLVVESNALRLYRQGESLTMVAEATLAGRLKAIAVDSVTSDPAGKTLAFLTVMDGEAPASRIYLVTNGTLQLVAENLPYMFRSVALYGGPARLYAQQMGRVEDFYGDVFEASYAGGELKLTNPIKMPRHANVFNFNMFRDASGKSFLTAFSESGYLIVYSDKGEELWRSNDKFGGSETYFQRRDKDNERNTGNPFRTRYIDQRISITDAGEILVPQNSGFLVLGNLRSYSKYSIFSFVWNGSSLEERWRTKPSQNYLADYVYQPASRELVLLEVVQKEGLFGRGGSAIRVIKAE